MKSFNTAAFEAKPIFSLTFSDGFITLLGLVAKMGVTGSNIYFPFVMGISFRTGVAALSSAGTWFTISVGHSCCSH